MKVLLDECVDWRLLRDLIILRGRTTRLRDLRELLPELRAALAQPRRREFVILRRDPARA